MPVPAPCPSGLLFAPFAAGPEAANLKTIPPACSACALMTASLLLPLAAVLVILTGLAGALLPALPGLPLMFAGAWLLAWSGGYQTFGAGSLITVGALAATGSLMDYVASLLGAKCTGASRQALWGAAAGSFAGLFFGLPGLVLGPLAGAAAGEYLARRELLAAGRVGLGAFAGFIIGTAAKLGCALSIVFVLLGVYLFSLL